MITGISFNCLIFEFFLEEGLEYSRIFRIYNLRKAYFQTIEHFPGVGFVLTCLAVHFTLIEAVADHIIEKLFADDRRISHIAVKIVKLAIAEDGEAIGITMARSRK